MWVHRPIARRWRSAVAQTTIADAAVADPAVGSATAAGTRPAEGKVVEQYPGQGRCHTRRARRGERGGGSVRRSDLRGAIDVSRERNGRGALRHEAEAVPAPQIGDGAGHTVEDGHTAAGVAAVFHEPI